MQLKYGSIDKLSSIKIFSLGGGGGETEINYLDFIEDIICQHFTQKSLCRDVIYIVVKYNTCHLSENKYIKYRKLLENKS